MSHNSGYDSPNKWNFYPGSPELEDQNIITPERTAIREGKAIPAFSPKGLNASSEGGVDTPSKWNIFPEEELSDNQMITPERMTLKQRYEYGRMMEKKNLEEKIRMYRINTGRAPDPAAEQVSRHIVEDNVWNEKMKDKKSREADKKPEITPNRKGMEELARAKKVLSQLDHVILQREPTSADVFEIFHAAREVCIGFDATLRKDCHDVNSVNPSFYLGTTQVFNANTLSDECYQYVRTLLASDSTLHRPLPLLCGVYSEVPTPELRVIAVAFRLNDAANSCLIALRISVSAGYEPSVAYGLRKVAVFHQMEEQKLFTKIVNVLPEPINSINSDSGVVTASSSGRHAYFGNISHNLNSHHSYQEPFEGLKGNDVNNYASSGVNYAGIANVNNEFDNELLNSDNHNVDDEDDGYGYREGDRPDSEPNQDDEDNDPQQQYDRSYSYSHDDKHYNNNNNNYNSYENDNEGGYYDERERRSVDSYDSRDDYSRSYSGSDRSYSRSNSDTEQDRYYNEQGDSSRYKANNNNNVSYSKQNMSYDYDEDQNYNRDIRYVKNSHISGRNSNSSGGRYTASNSSAGSYSPYRDDSTRTNVTSQGGTSSYYEDSIQDSDRSWKSKSPVRDNYGGHGGGSGKYSDGSVKQSVRFQNEDNHNENNAKWATRVDVPGMPPTAPKPKGPYQMVASDSKYARGLPTSVSPAVTSVFNLPVKLNEVKGVSCSTDLFIASVDTSVIVLQEPLLQPATVEAKYIVNNGKIFQWTKGIYMKGWLMKWPTKNQQSMGRLAKRFFVLKENILSYHKTEIVEDDDMLGTASTKFFTLTPECQVKIGVHNMQRCMKIITETEKIWIALNGENEMEIETRWVTALNAAIASCKTDKSSSSNSSTANSSSGTVWNVFNRATQNNATSVAVAMKATAPPPDYNKVWYNADPNVSLISCDALYTTATSSYVRVGLFQQAGVATIKKGVMDRHNIFSVDIGTDTKDKLHLPVVLTNENPVLQSDLLIVKLFGDMLIFGGKNGFVGIGSYGLTTGVAEGVSRKVMYCITCKQNTTTKSDNNIQSKGSSSMIKGAIAGAYPHSSSSVITSIAVGKRCHLFAAADSLGVISIWYLNKDDDSIKFDKSPSKTNLGFYYKIKPALQTTVNLTFLNAVNSSSNASERIVEMEFFNGDRYLIVTTNKRIVLLVLSQPLAHKISFVFVGWLELSRLNTEEEARFGFAVNENDNNSRSDGEFSVANKMVHWRLAPSELNSGKSGNGNRCSILKTEWTSEQFMKSLGNIKYL